MHNENELSDEESGHLARILMASRRVMQRQHFFSWVHGPLQSLIPHEILLCGLADDSGYLLHERFTACRYFKDDHFNRVIHPGDGLLSQLSQEWQICGEPRLIAAHPDESGGWNARLADLEAHRVGAVHRDALPLAGVVEDRHGSWRLHDSTVSAKIGQHGAHAAFCQAAVFRAVVAIRASRVVERRRLCSFR